jgi:adenylate kinase
MKSIVILLGAPGAGKGTQAVRLSKARSVPHVSTGDLFRENIKSGTPLGAKAQGYMDKGELVPDELVLDMLASRVAQDDCREGYVLDGFPRTEVQALALEERLQGAEVSVVNLEVADETIVGRAAGRLSCKQCGSVFHADNAPPRKAGQCDQCGSDLAQRSDDAPAVVRERLRVYHEKTAPLVRFYAERGLLRSVDGEQSPENVFAGIENLVSGRS